jgi:hypothetical protein
MDIFLSFVFFVKMLSIVTKKSPGASLTISLMFVQINWENLVKCYQKYFYATTFEKRYKSF